MTASHASPSGSTRRTFLQHGSAAIVGGALLGEAAGASPALDNITRADGLGDRTIRVGLIGCGGRGTGAANQALSTSGSVELVAMADAFSDRLESSLQNLKKQGNIAERVKVDDAHKYTGFDAYQRIIDDAEIDLVILTTPPGFRPMHFEYAIAKGKHVFCEKPVAVDAPGIRRVLRAAEAAKKANLKVGIGLQRHHSAKYQETVKRIQDGALGDIGLLRCYWNSGGVWVRGRQPEQTEMEYQMRNWYYFNWLCGDHITEQHIHNLDVCNWVMKGFPVEANGQGGRQVRNGKDHGEIFDHHMVEYTYEDGTKMISQCRHIRSTWSSVSEHVHGSLGYCNVGSGKIKSAGGWDWRFEGENKNAYQVEHDVLFKAVREDIPHMEAEYGAKSTMTSILGRMATYSGKVIKWDDALASEIALVPSEYSWEGTPPTVPDKDGRYPIPMPGSTTAV